ncbi:unnamed protein product [Heterobilharzia americana]|nr:unnamed protein product [Heterobilharzia americana]
MIHSLKKDEIKLGDKVSYQNIKRHAELDVLPDKTDIDFVLSLEKKVELAVVLPNGYPSWNSSYPVKPLVTLRLLSNPSYLGVNVRELSSRFNQWLDETANTGEPVLVASIDWLQNELTNGSLVTNESTKSLPRGQDLTGAERIICLWIISHHIRSSIKRRLILEWSKELELSGCCMPGRPGLIIVEGKETKADEYWRRLRNLQWKHIQLREREVLGTGLYKLRRFQDGFHEFNLSQQKEYKRVFGIPGRLPQGEQQQEQSKS